LPPFTGAMRLRTDCCATFFSAIFFAFIQTL
jgi:hypothetical protein